MGGEESVDGDLLDAYPFLVRTAVVSGDGGDGEVGGAADGAPFDYAAPIPDPARPSVPGRSATSAPSTPAPSTPAPYDYAAAEAAGAGATGVPSGPLGWAQARGRALRAVVRPLPPVSLLLTEALGSALAAPLEALTDLPAFDTSAMDGWAVSGPGPWRIGPALADNSDQLLAGRGSTVPLSDGTAVRIATGAQLPPGATAVLRCEAGGVRRDRSGGELLHDRGGNPLELGRDIRPRGQECRTGEPLLPQGTMVTPAVLGLAAAAGCDLLTVHRRPCVELLVLGDELLDSGLPGAGRTRDALSPLLPPWLQAHGARISAVRRVGDDLGLLRDALRRSPADVVVTTGGTAAGPADYLHRALAEVGAELLVDGVRVRPGHPMLLAVLPPVEGGATPRHLVGLPGNPLAAVAGAVTLAEPLLRALAGFPGTPTYLVEAAVPLPGHPLDTRLLPVVLPERGAVPLAFDGPAMLRGLALAEGLAVVPPGGVPAGARVEVLEVPAG